jgi:hypothetical protein
MSDGKSKFCYSLVVKEVLTPQLDFCVIVKGEGKNAKLSGMGQGGKSFV